MSDRDAHRLLDLDPELGILLSPERAEGARRELGVRTATFPVGQWDGERLAATDPGNLGLLLLDGVMAREVVVGDTVSTELLGSGDVIRPWRLERYPDLLPVSVRWNALSPVRVAVIDRRAAASIARYPEIDAVLVDRFSARAGRLAVANAISQMTRVDRRLVALFWHLAERWGRVGPLGIGVPLALSHRLLGQLVGARRPTVSTALAQLHDEGVVSRRPDGTWLLSGRPAELEAIKQAEVVRQRRRLMPASAVADARVPGSAEPVMAGGAGAAPAGHDPRRMAELQRAVEALQASVVVRARELHALRAQSSEIRLRTEELRRRRRVRREPPAVAS